MGRKGEYKVWVAEFLPPLGKQKELLESVAIVIVGDGRNYTEKELVELIKDVDGVLVTAKAPMTQQVIFAGEKLKVIGKYGVGVESVDLNAATARGIPVTYTPGVNQDTVAEFTISLILAVVRKIPFAMESFRKGGQWRNEKFLGLEMKGTTFGIVGLGRIGSCLAKKIRSFEVNLLGCDPYTSQEKAQALEVKLVDLETLLKTSDIVSLNLPLTPETFHLIGEKELRLMKPTSYLINTSRGSIIDEVALYRALKEGWIAGAGLDVFEKEPPDIDNPILFLENVVVTPHMGGSSLKARVRLVNTAVENVVKILKGEMPEIQNVANPQVLTKPS